MDALVEQTETLEAERDLLQVGAEPPQYRRDLRVFAGRIGAEEAIDGEDRVSGIS